MKGCCVYLELGTPWRTVFLIADSPSDANAFVKDVRIRAGLDATLAVAASRSRGEVGSSY